MKKNSRRGRGDEEHAEGAERENTCSLREEHLNRMVLISIVAMAVFTVPGSVDPNCNFANYEEYSIHPTRFRRAG